MSVPAIISPSHPHGQAQRRTYVHVWSMVPRSTMLCGVPRRNLARFVSTTIVGMLPTASGLYAGGVSTSEAIVSAASGAWKYSPWPCVHPKASKREA